MWVNRLRILDESYRRRSFVAGEKTKPILSK